MSSTSHLSAIVCIFCGQPSLQRKSTDTCAHDYKPPLQLLVPCPRLYMDADWILYTVDNEAKSVFIEKKDFKSPFILVGSGGIVLREIQLIYRSWQLQNIDAITQYLTNQYELTIEDTNEFIKILQNINTLMTAQSSAWSYDDLVFKDNCPTLPINRLKLMQIIDGLGNIPISKLLSEVVLHGQCDSKFHF